MLEALKEGRAFNRLLGGQRHGKWYLNISPDGKIFNDAILPKVSAFRHQQRVLVCPLAELEQGCTLFSMPGLPWQRPRGCPLSVPGNVRWTPCSLGGLPNQRADKDNGEAPQPIM